MTNPIIAAAYLENSLLSILQADLEQAGYDVAIARNSDVQTMMPESAPDLLLIGERLGKPSGLEWCKELRLAGITVPILLVLQNDALADRIACLQAGADDYYVLPYQRDRFLQLVHLYLQPTIRESGAYLKFDNLTLDLTTRTANRGGRTIQFTTKEYDLLCYLMEHPREVLTREQILENVWGYDFLGESNVIEVYIRYLRLKIEEKGDKKLIHTVRGVGYALRDT